MNWRRRCLTWRVFGSAPWDYRATEGRGGSELLAAVLLTLSVGAVLITVCAARGRAFVQGRGIQRIRPVGVQGVFIRQRAGVFTRYVGVVVALVLRLALRLLLRLTGSSGRFGHGTPFGSMVPVWAAQPMG